MQVSEEIITVLEYLCEKIGITIDWTSENVIPYIKELCEKYVVWEIHTSIAYIVIMGVLVLLSLIIAIVLHKTTKSIDGRIVVWLLWCMGFGISIIVICVQVFDIIECTVFPEKAVFEYVQALMARNT